MKFRDCIRSGLIMAIVMAWICEPLIDTALTIEPDGMTDIPWWMRIIGVVVCGSPILVAVFVVPFWLLFFMSVTDKAGEAIRKAIRRNQ